jgi:arylsulfatase A-like enzyme
MAGACAISLAASGQQKPERKPNIVFILADDLGWKDPGCYGNFYIETPSIDSLARNGIRFTQAYAACPVCSPTRASILTGKYPARLQLTNFLVGNRTDPGSPVLPARWKPYLEAREVTLAEILRQNGYTTGMVGKWHLGGHDSIAPWGQGFDWTRLIGRNGLDYYNYSIFADSYQHEWTDTGTVYITDKLTEYGVEFIEKNNPALTGRPFFLYLAYSAPHVYIIPRGDKLRKYLAKYGSMQDKYNPYYAAVVESLDDRVGTILATLKKYGLLENTLVIFTSDNGGLGLDEAGPTPTSMAPLRKWKGHVYEGGIRVPAIISWMSVIPRGEVCNQYFTTTDYFPTICEITGIKEVPEMKDGKSIVPVLLDPENATFDRGPVFWHYPHFSNQLGRPAGAVRLGDFKLVENYETGTLELYNLSEDISEAHDLSASMKDKTMEMYRLLNNWRKNVNAQMPIKQLR